jgi:hypothetical protein
VTAELQPDHGIAKERNGASAVTSESSTARRRCHPIIIRATLRQPPPVYGAPQPDPMSNSAHILRFFVSDEEYVQAACDFLREGIVAGETCVAMATAEHHRQIDACLLQAGLNTATLAAEYRYIPLPAEQTLQSLFDPRAGIDRERFHRHFNLLVSQAAARGQPVRIFGEMVSLLAEQGHPAAAIELEELWNELSRHRHFTLFCSYKVSPFTQHPRYRKILHSLHSYVCEDA